jgi:hypothetical protein
MANFVLELNAAETDDSCDSATGPLRKSVRSQTLLMRFYQIRNL